MEMSGDGYRVKVGNERPAYFYLEYACVWVGTKVEYCTVYSWARARALEAERNVIKAAHIRVKYL